MGEWQRTLLERTMSWWLVVSWISRAILRANPQVPATATRIIDIFLVAVSSRICSLQNSERLSTMGAS